ncbi:41952_t:CDS:1, partial [Gigaspora margarita]
MSKKLSTRTCKFLRSDATHLSPKAIEAIRNAQNNIPNAQRIMCQKYHIGATTYQKIIDNQRPPKLTEEWRRILDSVSVSDRISENNKESLQLVSAEHDTSPTNIQEDKISRKKKIGMKAKGESYPIETNRIVNTFKDDTSATE